MLSLHPLAFGQRGGERIFEFVNLPISARATALGGSQIAAITNDYGLVGGNPAMLNASMDKTLIFQHNFHFAGIDNGYAGFARNLNGKTTTIHGGVRYMSYGPFTATDEMGNVLGEFKAKDISLQAGISKELNERMSGGILLQYVQSSLESYSASGLLMDIGITYRSENELTNYAFVVRGFGVQLSRYYEGDEAGKLPVDVQFGLSKRLEHVPFRLTVLLHDINRWDLNYDSPFTDDSDQGIDNTEPDTKTGFDQSVNNFFSHITLGGEFLIGKKENFMLRFGYDFQRHKELSVVNLRSLAGFSAGVGVNVKSFILDYGFAVYHQGGSSKHIGIRVNLNELKSKTIVD